MKKIYKILIIIIIIIASPFIILFAINYGVIIKEYFAGNKYVSYWENHPENFESIKHNETFTFKAFDEKFTDNDIILFGEFHGTKQAQKIDLQFIKYLNRNFQMRNHFVELDFSQAYFINEYLKTGNDTLINFVLKDWIVFTGRKSKDYYDKWTEIKELNKTLPDSLKIRIIGIDKIQDFKHTREHLKILFTDLKVNVNIPEKDSILISWAKNDLSEIIKNTDTTNNSELIKDLKFIQENIAEYNEKGRAEFMFDNFKKQYERYNLANEKLYGYMGFGHVIQKGINDYDDFGTLLRKSDLKASKKTFTITSLIVDSYMGAPTMSLPEPMRDNSEISKIPYSFDFPLIIIIKGVNDLKRVTEENTNTLFLIDKENSPYKKSLRLLESFSILPIFPESIKITAQKSVTTDYEQGIILIRNSNWAEPL